MKIWRFFYWLILSFLPLGVLSCYDKTEITTKKQENQPQNQPRKDRDNLTLPSAKKENPESEKNKADDNLDFSKKPFNHEGDLENPLNNPMLRGADLLDAAPKSPESDNSGKSKDTIAVDNLIENPSNNTSLGEKLDFSGLNSLLGGQDSLINLQDEDEFRKINQKSQNEFKVDQLSSPDQKVVQKVGFDSSFGNFPSIYQSFYLGSPDGIKQENKNMFLGQKNEDLNIYLFDKIKKENVTNNDLAKIAYHSYYNEDFRQRYFPLNYIGFKSLDYTDQRYLQTFQRNIRFSPGTAILLDNKDGESLFLTNAHVLYYKGRPFWERMGYPFMRFYYNDKVNDLSSLGFSGLLSLFWIKSEYDRTVHELQTKGNFTEGEKRNIPIRDASQEQIINFSINLHNRWFRLAQGFNNYGRDMGMFYFNHGLFRQDINDVLAFYDRHKESLISTFRFANGATIDSPILFFKEQFKTFEEFWDYAKTFSPLKINGRIWKDGDIDYSTKIAGFWPQLAFSKNIFKGVYVVNGMPRFFTANGPGASGSGVFNENGELVFMNQMIVLSDNQKKLYYDQNNLSSQLTIGILFRDGKVDLASEIIRFYYQNQPPQSEDQPSSQK
ncbi:serine protease [Mesomycoplasma hyopneumoniae]|uniref:serine protease n=1 Tax=Mesomycoplasma hyopneumoniae TaxID=2099 RepID=UPI001F0B5781|nr:serine protease [Mesomycoplasma hyopneumoniae]